MRHGEHGVRFEVPSTLRTLFANGHLDYWGGRSFASLSDAARRKRMRSSRDHVFWWTGIEWDRSLTEVEAPRPSLLRGLRPGLHPYAGNGYGDEYCFYPRWGTEDAPLPVVFVVHDEFDGSFFHGRDIDESLVRCFLESSCEAPDEEDDEDDEPDRVDEVARQASFQAHRAILRGVVGPRMQLALDALPREPTRAECASALERLVGDLPRRTLVGHMQPVSYEDATIERYFGTRGLLDAYSRSERFYAELVEDEGRVEHANALARVRRRLNALRAAAR